MLLTRSQGKYGTVTGASVQASRAFTLCQHGLEVVLNYCLLRVLFSSRTMLPKRALRAFYSPIFLCMLVSLFGPRHVFNIVCGTKTCFRHVFDMFHDLGIATFKKRRRPPSFSRSVRAGPIHFFKAWMSARFQELRGIKDRFLRTPKWLGASQKVSSIFMSCYKYHPAKLYVMASCNTDEFYAWCLLVQN